jgi:hypothetical protein
MDNIITQILYKMKQSPEECEDILIGIYEMEGSCKEITNCQHCPLNGVKMGSEYLSCATVVVRVLGCSENPSYHSIRISNWGLAAKKILETYFTEEVLLNDE